MNRNLRKTVAIALTLAAFSAVMPASNFNFTTTKAYASSGELSRIKLEKSNGSKIQIYDDDDYKSRSKVDNNELDTSKDYYAKTTSSKIKVDTDGVDSDHVRIFKGTNKNSKGVKPDKTIELSRGSRTTLTIRTYNDDPDNVKYDDSSWVDEYTIKVKCTSSSSDDNDDEDDDVYLKTLYLSDGDFDFSKKTSEYNVNVSESVDEVKVTAKPDCDSDDYDDYEVTIDGSTVDDDDDFKRTVSLNKGENEIKVTVEDNDDNKRTYTLNINRGNTNTTNNTNTATAKNDVNTINTAATVQANQWVQVGGQWQYNDILGNPIKNGWVGDYYLKYDGNMAIGWQYINNTWYYFNPNAGGPQGSMYRNRWAQDSKGLWYYLGSDGSMVKNTVINGYKIGWNGAMV